MFDNKHKCSMIGFIENITKREVVGMKRFKVKRDMFMGGWAVMDSEYDAVIDIYFDKQTAREVADKMNQRERENRRTA